MIQCADEWKKKNWYTIELKIKINLFQSNDQINYQINNRNIDCMKQKFENRNLIEIFKSKKIKFPINKI